MAVTLLLNSFAAQDNYRGIMLRQLNIAINLVPESRFDVVLITASSENHKFSEPVRKDYTFVKSQFLST